MSTDKTVIEFDNVTKMYGTDRGVMDVTLRVQKGTIFGFLGPNGAGKTTSISLLIDMIRPSQGQIKILGMDSQQDSVEIRKNIGFLAGDIALDNGLTGWQQLEYYGNLRGRFDKKYIAQLAKRLNCDLTRKFKKLSRGNKQKVGLIAALMHKPDILILDEPTSGLDPLIQAEFNKIILEHKKAGKTAFISSHILSEVQEICDQVAFIRDGRVIAEDSVEKLAAGLPREVKLMSRDKKLLPALKKLKGYQLGSQQDGFVTGTYAGDVNELLTVLARHKLESLHMHDADLESVFMNYYGGDNA